MKKADCMKKKKTKKKAWMVFIVGAMIGGAAVYFAERCKRIRKRMCKSEDPSADFSKKENGHIVLNDTCVDDKREVGTDSKCNSPEWERGPES